jgi:hypothetical protein
MMVDKPRKVIVISGRQLAVAVFAVLLSVATMVAVNIVYTNYVDQQSNSAWCDIIDGLDQRYSKLPPSADSDAIIFGKQIAKLKKRYHC